MLKHLNYIKFLKNNNAFFYKAQIFAVTHFYLFFLSFFTLIIKLFIYPNQSPIQLGFWIFFAIFAIIFGETSLRFKEEKDLTKFVDIVISLYIIIGVPVGVFVTGSITTPSSLYVIVGLTLIAMLTSGKIKKFLNIYVIGFCLYYLFIEYKFPTVFNIKIPTYEENFVNWALSSIVGISFFIKLFSTITNLSNNNREIIIKQSNELYEISITDYLTNIYNKKYLYEILEELITDLNKNNNSFILIAIDIDYFKIYNDTYGHLQGDSCLKQVSSILENSFTKDKGYTFRFGGEEFVIALKSDNLNEGINTLKTIYNDLNKKAISNINSPITPFLTLSSGIIVASKKDRIYDVNYLLHFLDQALYKAKENGRNQSWAYNNKEFWKVELN